jgi:hypothetical protein
MRFSALAGRMAATYMAAHKSEMPTAAVARCKNLIGGALPDCAVSPILAQYSRSAHGGFLQKRFGPIF